MQPTSVKVLLKKDKNVLLEGTLFDRIKVEDSIWNIEDESKLIITFEKAVENIWKTVIKGDKEIDDKTVDMSKPLQDFDWET